MTAHRALVSVAITAASFVLGIGTVGCGSASDPGSSDSPEASIYDGDEEALAQEEWESQQGEDWEQFDEGYLYGWESGCDVAFEGSPDGSLYDQGNEYTADACYDLVPYDASDADVPFDVPISPYDDGFSLGETDGCVAAFDELTSYGVLNWGEDSYDESVCP